MECNISDIHPGAIITVFYQNVRNRKMREEMAMTKVRDVADVYALADRCACAEEVRRLAEKDAG